jgi:phosphomannomutase/phosphoglucomutase
MFKSKKPQANPENLQGITAQGNILRRTWIVALMMVLVPALAGAGYLLALRETSLRDEQVRQVAATWALHQASQVEQHFNSFQSRLLAAAASPLARSAISATDPADIAGAEHAMLDYFPGATSVRLIPIGELGTATLEGDNLGLRNHIEVDLLRRASAGEPTDPESYQFDDQWLTSMAVLVSRPGEESRRALMLVSIDNTVISKLLQTAGEDDGHSSLQQVYQKGTFSRADEIATAGNGTSNDHQVSQALNSDRWNLVFTPSEQLLQQLLPSNIPLLLTLLAILLTTVGGMVYLLLVFQRKLAREVDNISAAADKRLPMVIAIPELLPLARQLNRETSRRGQVSRSDKATAEETVRTSAGGGLSDPMFQKESMIVEDSDDDFSIDDAAAPPPMSQAEESAFPAHIFRAYDIRGIAETELTDAMVARIGAAIGTLSAEQGQQALLVACDGRTSSPRIKATLVKSLLASGRDVVDIGIVPTPLLYYATHTRESRSGVMVTGSHNPRDYNGLKIVIDGHTLSGERIQDLHQRVLGGTFSEGAGKLHKFDVREDYINAIIGDMAIAVPLKIVVDAGNGVAGTVAPGLLELLGCEVVPLYCEVDGNFPNHHPDPSDEDNLQDLCARVVAEEADLGVAFDGDGDRLAVVTAEGEIVRTDKLMMLYAQDVVSRNPGADVVCDVKCSRHLTQVVSRYGGRPILWKTGHSFMREKIQETGALLGGEFSGHIFFAERWYGFDDGLYAAARLAEILSTTETGLRDLLAEFPTTYSTPEIRIPVGDDEKFDLVKQFASQADFAPGKVNTLDGIRVDYSDCWGLLRASNTVPALTARFEGDTPEALTKVMSLFREQMAAIEPELDPGF